MPPTILVLLQIVIVISLSRLMGWGCKLIKQPLVIGEIIAGIMLGPSLLGLIFPNFATILFPASTLSFLNVLSEIGLIFFMFLIGLELNPQYLAGQFEVAILISHVSIVIPFTLGSILALLLYPLVSDQSVSFTAFSLFLGAAMSITAFPVLARIITENNLQGTRLGNLALTCAAVDDVTAWCLLALAIAVTRTNNIIDAFPTIIASIIYIIFMFTIGRKFLQKIAKNYEKNGKLTQLVLASIYIIVVTSSLITELIGIHLIFGAFLIGVIMPKNPNLIREIAEKTEDFVLIFLLPIFFAYSGLKTQIGLLNRPELWLLCGIILAVAILGKYVGTYCAARFSGIEKREASALGWLMNTRGLTELIVLNIGLSLGVISPLLFTMLVIMALVTTFMTSPILEWTYPKHLIRLNLINQENLPIVAEKFPLNYSILVPVAHPQTQKRLLELALSIGGNHSIINPLSFVEIEENYWFESTPEEAKRIIENRHQELKESIIYLNSNNEQLPIQPIVRISNNIPREIGEIAMLNNVNLIILGCHHFTFSNNLLGGRVGQILNTAPADVAVYINKNIDDQINNHINNHINNSQENLVNQNILVAYATNIHDDLALVLGIRMLFNDPKKSLQVLHFSHTDQEVEELSYELKNIINLLPVYIQEKIKITHLENDKPLSDLIAYSATFDLTIAGANKTWGIERQNLGRYTDVLAQECQSPLLIARRYSPVVHHINSLLNPLNFSS